MAKKPKKGRPLGPKKKVPVNVFMEEDRRDRLRERAAADQKTQSIIVENALAAYGV